MGTHSLTEVRREITMLCTANTLQYWFESNRRRQFKYIISPAPLVWLNVKLIPSQAVNIAFSVGAQFLGIFLLTIAGNNVLIYAYIKEKSMKEIWMATLETRHFSFMCCHEQMLGVLGDLASALEKHCEQNHVDFESFMCEYKDAINIQKVVLGTGYIDGEPI